MATMTLNNSWLNLHITWAYVALAINLFECVPNDFSTYF